MSTPSYQFSLRSLLLFTLFIAVLCSIGVCTHWIVSAVIAVGGTTGGIVAGKWFGAAMGAFFGSACSVAAANYAALLCFFVPLRLLPMMVIGAIVGALVGGILGGRAEKRRSRE
jgi:Trk-type K+ transport system membrane component